MTTGSKVWLHEEIRAAVYICMENTGKVKTQLELTVATVVSEIFFFKYVNSTRRLKQNTEKTFDADSQLTSKDKEKAEAFNALCLSL